MAKTITRSYTRYTAKEFLKLSDEKREEIAELHFDSGRVIEIDESLYVTDGKLSVSSFNNGLVDWDEDKGEYVHMYYCSARPLGQLKYAVTHEINV